MGTDQVAFKTILKNGATVIGNLVSVGAGGVKVENKDTTHHGLTDPYRTKRQTLVEAQNIKAKVQMTSAQVAALYAFVDPTATLTSWTVTYPFTVPIVFTFTGALESFSVADAEVDSILEVELEIMTSGKPTLA